MRRVQLLKALSMELAFSNPHRAISNDDRFAFDQLLTASGAYAVLDLTGVIQTRVRKPSLQAFMNHPRTRDTG